jgi:tetratricopeptide (TPR) repeat protein
MGSSLFQKKKYHDSVTIFNEALNFMPQDSGIYINRGDAYRELKKFNLALSDYHYALDLLTTDGNGGIKDTAMIRARLSLTHYALGSQCFNQKDYEGANIEFTRAIEYLPAGNAEYYVNRARACLEMGSFEAAYADLQKALEIDPCHDMASSLLQNFNRDKRVQYLGGGKFVKPT